MNTNGKDNNVASTGATHQPITDVEQPFIKTQQTTQQPHIIIPHSSFSSNPVPQTQIQTQTYYSTRTTQPPTSLSRGEQFSSLFSGTSFLPTATVSYSHPYSPYSRS
jgi:hypothetical protein